MSLTVDEVPRIEDEQSTLDLYSKPAGADSSPQTLPHAGRRRGRLARLNLTPAELAAAKATALKNRLAELDEARKILCPTEAEASSDLSDRPDCLIVAIRFYPVDITLLLMQFLPPGRPFVVHSHLLAPLVDLYNILKRRGSCAHLTLFDSWLRPIQVLPNRTHPEMKMTSGCGGFLLRGYTVQRLEDDNVLCLRVWQKTFLGRFHLQLNALDRIDICTTWPSAQCSTEDLPDARIQIRPATVRREALREDVAAVFVRMGERNVQPSQVTVTTGPLEPMLSAGDPNIAAWGGDGVEIVGRCDEHTSL
ncbi:unnamed protein product [Schistocephalus solidus]|uniref:tRNA (adenine(58)-N(1))-methyltransferase non-catalytic subunit TRM6 n=1 Tax=Schistocephalus solidus TaxID=70667 RepID=A0A183S8P1_SCHSO|nr:unnamed protein product [Schistocephalus solidus]